VKREIRKALRKNLLHSYIYSHDLREKLSAKLAEFVLPQENAKCFMLSSGTEATEAAVRLMRLHGMTINPDKRIILSFNGAMHGRTMAALLLKNTGFWKHEDFAALPFHDAYGTSTEETVMADLEKALQIHVHNKQLLVDCLKDCVAGIVIEGYQGWSARMLPKDYMKELRKIMYDAGVLICFDEIQSGFYRTGERFAFYHYGFNPDLVCIGKAIGGGLPLSAVVGKPAVMDIPQAGEMSSTHSANPICCAAGLGIMKAIDRLCAGDWELKKKSNYLYEEFNCRTSAKRLKGIYGKGFVWALIMDSKETADMVVRVCAERGLLLVHTGRESVKIGMPLTITTNNLTKGITILKGVLHDCCC
jgi:4-aminobutyrate aminotransferase / (S)-3-amino-2-methylpropionate transaminase / 5-aminovalerate transaminase